jgi:hypothetical protein
MRASPEICDHYALECRAKARAVHDPHLKALYGDLADQWHELASIRSNLRRDARYWAEFRKSQASAL